MYNEKGKDSDLTFFNSVKTTERFLEDKKFILR